jgi:hypothetical protein
MAYRPDLVSSIQKNANTDGNKLGRQAVRLDFSVIRIAKATGATRQTVYNWFLGKPVAPYYVSRVTELLDILSSADTAEHAWRDTCLKFDLKA